MNDSQQQYNIPQGIRNSLNANSSYAHSVLQSLCFLQVSNKIFSTINSLNMRYKQNYPLINELLNIISTVQNKKIANSQNLLYYYSSTYNKYRQNEKNIDIQNAMLSDPFQFFYYLLQFLHFEINMPNNNNLEYLNQYHLIQKDDDKIYSLYMNFICNNQNSIITNIIFNIMKYTYKCQNCGIYYSYGFQHILRFNVDLYTFFRNQFSPNKKGTKLTLDDIFKCYCGGNTTTCKHCGNKKALRHTKISLGADIIIIYFERKNHVNINDIDYPFQFDIKEYLSKKRNSKLSNVIYDLKAVISYTNYGNVERYFVDCKVPKSLLNNNNVKQDIWIRYLNSDICILNNSNKIFVYEPQILVYEISEIINNANPMMNNIYDDYSIDNKTGMNNNSNNSIYSNVSISSNNSKISNNLNSSNNSNISNISDSSDNAGFKMNNNNENNAKNQIVEKNNPKFSYDFDVNDYFLKLNHLNLYEGMEDLLKKYLNLKEFNSKDFTYIYNTLNLNKDIKKGFNKKDINEYLIKKNSNNSDDESDSGGSNPYFNYAPSNKIIQQVNEFNKTNIDKKIDIKQNKNENKDNKFKENTNLMKMYAAENLNNNNESEFYI